VKAFLKYILQILIATGVTAGVFFAFEWQTATAILTLTGLLVLQIYFISSKIKPKGHRTLDKSAKTLNLEGNDSQEKAYDQTQNQPFDSSVFSKFQANLDASEKQRGTLESALDLDEVVVSISPQAQKNEKTFAVPIPPTKEPKQDIITKPNRANPYIQNTPLALKDKEKKENPSHKNLPKESIGTLFDDVRDPLIPDHEPTKKVVNQPKAKVKPTKSVKIPAPIVANESLTLDDLSSSEEQSKKEEAVFQVLAKNAFEKKKFSECLNLITQWIKSSEFHAERPPLAKEILKLKGDCEFSLKQFEDSSLTWQKLIERMIKEDDQNLLGELESLLEKFSSEKQHTHALKFYLTALGEYKKTENYPKMDQIYSAIELAYKKNKDWGRLIHTYQNHLSIKKSLKDHQGQLSILDQLGKLLYDQGDSDGSKRYYQQSIEIKNELSKQTG